MSCLRSNDLEWYFLCPTERKYSNGSRRNRTTKDGYGFWKTTGNDKSILYNKQDVGTRKSLIFHTGKAPQGDRTNWVMHEYGLKDEALVGAGNVRNAYVICKIFQKNDRGPNNGAQYGAPFNEEEWSDYDFTGPPSTLPNNPSSSALTSTLISATTCVGSSSETTHLETVPCPDNMHPKYDASMPDIALPTDILSSPAAGLTDDTTVQHNHEHNEILDKDNNNMYDDLGEDIAKWLGLPENHCFIDSEVDFSNNQMFCCEDGVNLEDLAYPLEDPSNMKECIPTSTGPSHFSLYNSSKQSSYPFNYSDEHAPSTSQIQSSGSYWYGNNVLDNGVKGGPKQMYQEDTFWNSLMEWELSNE